MNLFENEVINISGIKTVNMYDSDIEFTNNNVHHYDVNLSAYELIFFISGENETHFANADIHDVPDSLRFLPKGIPSGEYYVKKLKKGVCIDIYFDTLDSMPCVAMSLKNMNELKPLFVKIYNVWNEKKPGYYAKSMSILYEITEKIKRHNDRYYTNCQAQKIFPSYEYAVKHFCDHNFDYTKMCSESKLSYDYFKELFIKQYGMSPVKYITKLRIEKAQELLITNRYKITDIANMCGFENVYYFSTVFKKQVGVSPKNYK